MTGLYIVAAILVFIIIVVGLAIVIMWAKKKLMPAGNVKILVNNDKVIDASPGSSLLDVLVTHGIMLPSACGGGGTCGQCRLKVLEGGGDVLPTELNHLSRREVKEGWRLACQVKIRQDLKIEVPAEVFGIKKWECEVISNKNVATYIKELVVRLPEGERLDFEPGQYCQLYAPAFDLHYGTDIKPNVEEPYRQWWEEDFGQQIWELRAVNDEDGMYRAYSMANYPAEGHDIMKFNIRIALPPWDRKNNRFKDVPPGKMSSYVFSLKPGDKITISGPYGDFLIKPTDKEKIYIGGGAGMAPLRAHIMHLLETMKTKAKVSYWYGARSKREIFYEEDFRRLEQENPNFKFVIALSEPKPTDNWDGPVGFIHQVLYDMYLKDHPEPEECEYYICGPPPMLKAVLNMLDELGVPKENIAFDDFGG